MDSEKEKHIDLFHRNITFQYRNVVNSASTSLEYILNIFLYRSIKRSVDFCAMLTVQSISVINLTRNIH